MERDPTDQELLASLGRPEVWPQPPEEFDDFDDVQPQLTADEVRAILEDDRR